VLDHLVGGDRRARGQEPGPLHGGAERFGIILHAQVAHHRHQRRELVLGEPLDQAIVEERDPAARLEQVVSRVRVAVERVQLVQAAEHVAVNRLGR
jgi:hypothetical protein